MHRTWKRTSITAVALLAGVASTSFGCAAPPIEPEGKTTSKLLAPKALVKVAAGSDTKEAFGIAEWRVYRGKGDVVVTGYDARGKAVKGIALGFDPRSSSARSRLRGRALDGTRFHAAYEYGGRATTSGAVSTSTARLFMLAMADLRGSMASFHILPPKPAPAGAGGAPAPAPAPGAPPLPAPQMPGGEGCGADLMVMITSALQCLMQSGGDPSAAMQCVLAAQSGMSAGASCTDPSAGGLDPSAMCGDPYGGAGGDPYGGAGGDPSGGAGGDPGGDPNGAMCTDPGGMADQAGAEQECPSCPAGAGYGDIQGDPDDGEVDPAGGGPYGDEGAGGDEGDYGGG